MTSVALVLVHGAWHSPAIWNELLPHLATYETTSLQLPSAVSHANMHDDAVAIRQVIEKALSQQKHVVIVAHSYGGIPASEACRGLLLADRKNDGQENGVIGIVYLASMSLPVGASLWPTGEGVAKAAAPAWCQVVGATVQVTRAHETFYGQLPVEDATLYTQQLTDHSMAAFLQPVTYAAFEHCPTAYLVCTQDRAFPPQAQRGLIASSKKPFDLVREIDSDHSPFLPPTTAECARFVKEAVQLFSRSV